MKKYATVPFLCKLKRFASKVLNSGIRIKQTNELSLCRDRNIVPDKKFSLGGECFISIKTIFIAVCAALAAVCAAVLAARITFLAAVYKAKK